MAPGSLSGVTPLPLPMDWLLSGVLPRPLPAGASVSTGAPTGGGDMTCPGILTLSSSSWVLGLVARPLALPARPTGTGGGWSDMTVVNLYFGSYYQN